ncbi:MAG: hypothetical protein MRZ79_01605 [Bacteroidia bacterium]|nr:hypothetical protein [Bacteroidia bacterium]
MRLFVAVLMFKLLAPNLKAQYVLSLENTRKFKRITFQEGDFMRFRVYGDKRDYNGNIQSISDSVLVIVKNVHVPGENEEVIRTTKELIRISDISMVYYAPKTYGRSLRTGYYRSTLVTGGIFIATTSVRTLATGETPSRQEILMATGILSTGLLARFMGKDVYKIGRKWQLKSMNGFYIPIKQKFRH